MADWRREHLAALSAHFRAERRIWPDLWHAFVVVGEPGFGWPESDAFLAAVIGNTRETVAKATRPRLAVPSAGNPRATCHHYFMGGGYEAFSTLARLTLGTVGPALDVGSTDPVTAPLHWLEAVHATVHEARHGPRINLRTLRRKQRGMDVRLSMLEGNVFLASSFTIARITDFAIPLPALLARDRFVYEALVWQGIHEKEVRRRVNETPGWPGLKKRQNTFDARDAHIKRNGLDPAPRQRKPKRPPE